MRPQIDWIHFRTCQSSSLEPTFTAANSTSYVSFLFDFTYLSTNNSGYIGVSGFSEHECSPGLGLGDEKMFMGKRWYNDFRAMKEMGLGQCYSIQNEWLPGCANCRRWRTTTVDMYVNPPLSGLPPISDLTVFPGHHDHSMPWP